MSGPRANRRFVKSDRITPVDAHQRPRLPNAERYAVPSGRSPCGMVRTTSEELVGSRFIALKAFSYKTLCLLKGWTFSICLRCKYK